MPAAFSGSSQQLGLPFTRIWPYLEKALILTYNYIQLAVRKASCTDPHCCFAANHLRWKICAPWGNCGRGAGGRRRLICNELLADLERVSPGCVFFPALNNLSLRSYRSY